MTFSPNDSTSTFEWFGMPRTMTVAHASQVVLVLRLLLEAQTSAVRAAGPDAWATWFDPLARGASLRDALDNLPPTSETLPPDLADSVGEPLVTPAGPSRALVTPEGRLALTLLENKISNAVDDQIRVRHQDTEQIAHDALDFYKQRSFSRLRSVVDFRSGDAPPLLPQGVGLILLLLLNGNVGADHPLARPSRSEDREVIDAAVASIVSAFAETLVPSRRGRTPDAYSLYGGYAMTEARRRLGSDLTKDPAYLVADSRTRVISRVADEVARRTSPPTEEKLELAISALVRAYLRHRPDLAGYGLAQGSESDGRLLQRDVLAAYRQARRG